MERITISDYITNYLFWFSPTALQLTSQPFTPDQPAGLTLSVGGSDAQGQELLVLLNRLARFIDLR